MTRRYTAIVPNYNDSATLGESVRSLAAQTFPFHEILIIDDGSDDSSMELIAQMIADIPQAKLIRHEVNKGVVAAINTGIDMATGDYIYLCSANDIYYPHMVARCEDMLTQCPEVGIVSGNVAAYDQSKQAFTYDMKLPLPQVAGYYSPELLMAHNRQAALHFNGGANALRLDLVRRYGKLYPELRWHSDWFLNLMIAFDTGVAFVPENFCICRLEGKKSYSNNRFHWPSEREVIRNAVRLLAKYPKQAALFRRSALLPKFEIKGVGIFMEKEFRWFLTPLLIWRMVMYSITYRSKYILPRPLLMALRPYFRL